MNNKYIGASSFGKLAAHRVRVEPRSLSKCVYYCRPLGYHLIARRNHFMQAKLDVLAAIAEERDDTETNSYRVLMVGDSTMSHQFGSICGFMAERNSLRFSFNPEVCAYVCVFTLSRAAKICQVCICCEY